MSKLFKRLVNPRATHERVSQVRGVELRVPHPCLSRFWRDRVGIFGAIPGIVVVSIRAFRELTGERRLGERRLGERRLLGLQVQVPQVRGAEGGANLGDTANCCRLRTQRWGCTLGLLLLFAWAALHATDLVVPQRTSANSPVSIPTSGDGEATFYLIGPTTRLKQNVRLGDTISLKAQDLREAGQYVAVLRADGSTVTRAFFVDAANPANLNFLAQPSRVPAGVADAISGTAFLMDPYQNLVLAPTPVRFELTVDGAAPITRTVTSRDGLAWTRMGSSSRAGNAQFTASFGETKIKRIVQQTAADPCNLRIHAQRSKGGILIETDPVRDCSGNPVPDGTIVTFTGVDAKGKSTVDARVKKGIARAELPAAPGASISVASGVVVSNEIRWGGGR